MVAHAKDPSYVGSVHVVRGNAVSDIARGTVFLDANRDSRLDPGERGIPGVMVSNGREVVVTDAEGAYVLPAYDDMNLFVTKPAGYATPVNADLVPQFNYVHKVAGSPPLRFGGIAPTGPLPAAVNFPLIEDRVGDRFQCLIFGDTQAYTNRELSYVRDTVGRMLANRDNGATECLIFEGDVLGDDLSLATGDSGRSSRRAACRNITCPATTTSISMPGTTAIRSTRSGANGVPNTTPSISARCISWCWTTCATRATASTTMRSATSRNHRPSTA